MSAIERIAAMPGQVAHSSIQKMESEVRYYSRLFPAEFARAKNHQLFTSTGQSYIDLLAGAGALNLGHNNEVIKEAVIRYLSQDGVLHSLDMWTEAKHNFIKLFRDLILQPRGLDYRLQFPGPTGTNAVEAALKLARKVTGRQMVVSFTNAFHGVSLGALAATGNIKHRAAAGIALPGVYRLPYDGYAGAGSAIEFLRAALNDSSSGIDKPAAILVETVQAEGGINVASAEWLHSLSELAKAVGALLIIDDIQVGCGRIGSFFSFEGMGFVPDIVCLSKSLSGIGLPLSLVLIRPDIDLWEPGEHNGTFRGNNLALVAGAKALEFWRGDEWQAEITRKGELMFNALSDAFRADSGDLLIRGRGMIRGVAWRDESRAQRVAKKAFERGILVETCGARSQVLKLIPPLTIPDDALLRAIDVMSRL